MSKLAHSNQETMDLIEAHRLAEEIEWTHAKVSASDNKARGRGHQLPAQHYYDPLAATVLGDLIYKRMTRKKP